jgi:hypothetical protein
MTVATTRFDDPRTSASKVVDADGQVWRHDNPAELYRWISRRNELLRTIAVALLPGVALSRR